DLPRWEGIFDREIKAREPQTHHYTFGWDDPSGALGSAAEFQAAGYELEQDVVLTASEVVRPPKWNSEITVRKVRSDADWEEALQTQLEARSPDHGIEGFERYSRRQFARYRNMAEAGLGDWWGAFLGDKMVAGLGLYVAGELGRFQQVVTRKAFRRQGICGTLVHEVSRRVLAGGRFKTLVIVAAEQEHAVKIYQNVGYVFRERMVQVCKWKKGT
ncbi:MAG: GNAT family N-acetyltransferase, partial [Bdellovibrionota bacterium]